jgi:hypothetical protein
VPIPKKSWAKANANVRSHYEGKWEKKASSNQPVLFVPVVLLALFFA